MKSSVIRTATLSTATLGCALVIFSVLIPQSSSAQGRNDWNNRITMSGMVEVEAFMGSNLAGGSAGDISLATLDLEIDAQVADAITAHVLVLHEDDATEPWEVDEGFVEFDWEPVTFSAGRMYLPFGTYETFMVSDPLTLELGETREAALHVEIEWEGLYGSFYIFNGDINTAESVAASDNTIDQMGFGIGFEGEFMGLEVNTGFDFIQNIADSNRIQSFFTTSQVEDYVSGWAVHAKAVWEPVTILFEYVAAGEFLAPEVPFLGEGAAPSALHLEAAVSFILLETDMSFAAGYQSTTEAAALDLPESKLLLALAVDVDKNVIVTGEFAHISDYAIEEGGLGEGASVITGQLAVGF